MSAHALHTNIDALRIERYERRVMALPATQLWQSEVDTTQWIGTGTYLWVFWAQFGRLVRAKQWI